MHLREPACKGAYYGTDRSEGAHSPHEFFPHQWAPATPCTGWSEEEANATAAVEQMWAYAAEHPVPDETRLEGHPAVIAGISRLLVPDFADEGAGIGHQLTRLFGVPLVAAPLGPGEWRLVTAGGEQQ